jgi:DNA-binding LacI/PurR family transcriptional regulator
LTLDEHGLAPDELVAEGDWTPASGEVGLERLLASAPDLDAVFASNDQMALGALHAAHRRGLRVPEDLALVGVDDIAEGSHYWPPLTTVHQPLREAGMLAVQTIDRLIRAGREGRVPEDPAAEASTTLKPRLVIRESSRSGPVSLAARRDR